MSVSRSLILLFLFATAMPLWAVQLRVQGEVTDAITRKSVPNVLVRIYKDGVKQHVRTTGTNGRYSVLLDNNATYVIRFSQPGLVTKCFTVSTHGPAWENDHRVLDLEVEMTMFAPVTGLDLTFFDLPLGIARFTPMTGHLSWDSMYEQRVKPEVDRLMSELHMRREQVAATLPTPQVPRN